jgi:quinol monooxygenase YgiN
MSVMVLLEAPVKPEEVSNMRSYMAEILPGSRDYEGCKGFALYFDTDRGNQMVLIENWDSRAHHEKYVRWRTETGVMAKLGGMLAGPPSIRYFEKAEA